MTANIQDSPDHTLIIVADDGKLYKLPADVWSDDSYVVTDPAEQGTVGQLANLGTFLAAIPDDFAAGAGLECIVVNVKLALAANASTTDVEARVKNVARRSAAEIRAVRAEGAERARRPR